MKFDIDRFIRVGTVVITIIGILNFEIVSWSEDPSYTKLAISGIYLIVTFLWWIILLLMDLNSHFEKLENDDDDEIY